jgi:pSer/pThr/pTyr-binding forkhead associated (FHA) protein
VDGSAFPLFGDSVVMGRERGDILFPEDGYVSGTHARISLRDGRVFINDVGSSNGTFLRVRGERKVPNATFVLMGQQLFRLEYK